MTNLELGLLILTGLLVVQSFFVLRLFEQAVKRLAEVNKQLLVVVAGKDEKPEALRALVALNKPPQGKLKGIADGKKEDKKPANTDYTVAIGT